MVRRILFLLFFLGMLAYLLWPYSVLELKTHNPTTTAIMELRQKEAIAAKRPLKTQMVWMDLDRISPALIHAIILSEDDTFYQHHGFDWEQMQIAFQRNWQKKRYVYGGSTITQQLARTLFLRPRKSLLRKIKEAVLTVYLEATLPKKRILELYLNVAEWGPGVYGAEAASEFYFSKGADLLTPDEGTALASILPSPRRWSPFSEKTFMARRRTQLMNRMRRAGYAPPTNFLDGDSVEVPFDPEAAAAPASDPIILDSSEPVTDPNTLAEPEHSTPPQAIPDNTNTTQQ